MPLKPSEWLQFLKCRIAFSIFCVIIFASFQIADANAGAGSEINRTVVNEVADSLAKQVVVRRTEYGVPHIQAENIRAAGYALGYIQAEDYGERIPEGLLRARGEWARYNDIDPDNLERVIDSDAANRRDYKRAVETWNLLEQDTRDIMEGFAVGVNRYIELHPDEFSDWVQPFFTGYDVHAVGITGPGGSSIRRFLNALEKRTSEDETKTASFRKETYPDFGTVWARLAIRTKDPHPDVGSNAWAFAPERTTSGNAILVRNPHLSWSAGYYEGQMVIPGKLEFYGDFRIGSPLGIIGGFNRYLGWATTNNHPDLDEIYALEADPDQPDHYLLDGASVPIQRETVTVEFKNGKSLGTETREFLTTPYGPVILRANGKIYIIHAAGDGEYRTAEQFLKMMKSQNLDEWKQAMKMRARTSSNLTYADADGNIFYVWNATTPDLSHESGGDTLAVDVSTSDEIWSKPLAWEELPQLENPKGGYLHNENDPFHFTNLHEILKEEDYPDHFPKPQLRLRSQHSIKLIDSDKKFSLEDITKLKHSMGMLLADRVKDDLVSAVKATNPTDEIAEALQLIEDWDNMVSKESRGSVLFKVWWNRYEDTADSVHVEANPEAAGFAATAENLFKEPWSPEKPVETPFGLADFKRAATSFEWAVQETKDKYGNWNIAWGSVHRARIGEKDLPVGGCTGLLGCFRVLWYIPHQTDENKLEVRGGDGWVFAVEFPKRDSGENPRAYSVLAYSQSSKEDSPHFNDQLDLFTNNKMKQVVFSEEDILDQLEREYHPGLE